MSLRNFHIHLLSLLMIILLSGVESEGVFAQSQQDESKRAPSTGTITGRVINENGQPVSHATIYVIAPLILPQPRTTTTDDGGNFQVAGLDALVYSLWAAAPAYVNTPPDPDSLASNHRIGDSVTITLIKGGVITGTVTSPGGEPMVQAGVRAFLIRDANGKPPTGARFPLERPTDDRGIYRIYGLATGTYVVSAGSRGTYGYGYDANPYDSDSPTYAPSSTRDTAAEVAVRAGEETSGVDIRYRAEAGHVVSGEVSGPQVNSAASIMLTQMVDGVPQPVALSFQMPNRKGFEFFGVGNGEYDLNAQMPVPPGELMAAEPLHITVRDGDVAGIRLALKTLPSISGHVALASSTALECRNKRRPLLTETLLVARRSDKNSPKDPLTLVNFSAPQTSADKAGDFLLRNLTPGPFSLDVRFFARYWYLRSIQRDTGAAQPSRAGMTGRQADIARTGINLKFGERISGVTVTLVKGAASFRGAVKPAEGENMPAKLYLHLVPAEKENAEDVLRFFTAPVQAEGAFAVNNLPPGRYWVLVRVAANSELQFDAKLRAPEEAESRAQIRRAAEAAKTEVELKPCQNLTGYQLPLKASLKN
jgi:hypothetical protein